MKHLYFQNNLLNAMTLSMIGDTVGSNDILTYLIILILLYTDKISI